MVTVQHYGTRGYSSAPWDMWLEFSTKGHVVRVQEYRIHGYSSALGHVVTVLHCGTCG